MAVEKESLATFTWRRVSIPQPACLSFNNLYCLITACPLFWCRWLLPVANCRCALVFVLKHVFRKDHGLQSVIFTMDNFVNVTLMNTWRVWRNSIQSQWCPDYTHGPDETRDQIIPEFKEIKALCCNLLVDCRDIQERCDNNAYWADSTGWGCSRIGYRGK